MWVLGAGGQGESLDVTEFGGRLPVSPGVNITLTTGEQLTQEEPSQAEQPRQRWQMSEWLVSKSVGVSFPSEPNSGLYCRDKKCLVLSVKVFNDFLYLFLQRVEGRERGKHQCVVWCKHLVRPLLGTWPATQACALTGNLTSDLWFAGLCSMH